MRWNQEVNRGQRSTTCGIYYYFFGLMMKKFKDTTFGFEWNEAPKKADKEIYK